MRVKRSPTSGALGFTGVERFPEEKVDFSTCEAVLPPYTTAMVPKVALEVTDK
jgi:hypothetical protein